MDMIKILIVEDDEIISESLKQELISWQYNVKCIKDFDKIIDDFNCYSPHLVLMDIVLPSANGFWWCGEIRKISKVPIIFISSKSEKMDVIMALQYGGDDYITKPLDLGICLMKINALLRRTYDYSNNTNKLNFENIIFNFDENCLVFNNKQIFLTKTENIIMYCLFKNKTAISSRENIIEKLWKNESFIDDNTLAVNINRMRKKLMTIGVNDLIITKKGSGYYLNKDYHYE